MAELKIDVQGLYKSHGDNEVLKGITTQFHEDDVVCIIGPSGSGKSTFLRTLDLPETTTSGKAIVDDHELSDPETDIGKVREGIGMVFQHSNLLPHMTALEDITFMPIELGRESKEKAEEYAMELPEQVDLADRRDVKPEGLPGGQGRRAAVVHSSAMNSDIVLLGGPTSTFDPEMVGDILNVMKNLVEQGTTMLIVTHEMGFACKIANCVIPTDGDGFLEDGTLERAFDNPQHPRLKDFLDRVLNV